MISISRRWLPSLRVAIPLGLIALMTLTSAGIASADSNAIDFDSGYGTGNINGQNGWSKAGAYDVEVENVADYANASGYGFATKALRISNAVASGSFGDQAISPRLTETAGEAGKNHFEASFDIGSATGTHQADLAVSVSPEDGAGSRMSGLRFEDETDGIHVWFFDVTNAGPVGTGSTFNSADIKTVDRTSAHSIRLEMFFVAGPGNDVVRVFVDDVLEHTGTSWENYYLYDPEQAGGGNALPVTDGITLLARNNVPVAPATVGNGYLIDNISIVSSDTVQCTTDCYVNAATGNDAFGGVTPAAAKKTIQAAVSQVSSGGTVQVAAGTYSENNTAITINKNLSIKGPNAGISPNTGSRVAEAVITSTASPSVFVISGGTSHVTFEGLKFDTSTAYMRDDWGDNIALKQNIFAATGGSNDGMYFENPTLTVQDNLFKNIDTPNADTLQVGGHYPSSNHALSITDNVWDTITSSGALNLSNVTGTVSGNTFSHVQYYGILVASASGNLDITSNTFDHITNPAPSTSATWGAGIRFYDAGATTGPVNVNKNSFTNSYLGVAVRAGSDITSADINVSRNAIAGNSMQGILNAGTGTLSAECNWYGNASGPTDGLTPSGTGDAVSGPIDYISWLTTNDLNGACDGTPQAISLLPSTWSFGNQNVSTTSSTKTFTVKNMGARDLTIQDVALHGTNPGHFGIDTNNCYSLVLAPNATCTILVDFRPTSAGSKTAQLDVTSNDPNHHVQSTTLSGNGTTIVVNNGTITIVLDSRPDDAQSFSFTGGLGAFNLSDPVSNSHTFSNIAPGDYVVQATKVNAWSLKSLTCTTSETIRKAKGKVTIHLASGENTTCTFTQTKRLADESIALTTGGTYNGVGIYSGTAQPSQTQNQAIGVGQTKSFFIHLTNNSLDSDSFNVFSTLTGSTKFAVKFFVGATDVTARVNAGTYNISLNAGQTSTVQVQVKALAGTPAAATRNIDLTMKSKSSTSKDVVRGHVSRV